MDWLDYIGSLPVDLAATAAHNPGAYDPQTDVCVHRLPSGHLIFWDEDWEDSRGYYGSAVVVMAGYPATSWTSEVIQIDIPHQRVKVATAIQGRWNVASPAAVAAAVARLARRGVRP